MAAFKNKTILQILDYYKNLWALSYVSAVSHWDLETYMPSKGAGARGEALAKISGIRQKMFLDKSFVALIHQAEKEKDLTDEEKGVVRVLLHTLKFYEKLPGDFLEEFEKLTNTATVIWREAKEKSDYSLFEPSLAKVFEMNRKMAEYLGYRESPYDALLDQFEEGLTVSEVEPFFGQIKDPLKDLLAKIIKSSKYIPVHPLETAKYDRKKMEALNKKVLEAFGADFSKFRFDVSAHPFTTSFGNTDTRITTRYHAENFAQSLLAIVHEFGHALYDLQCADELEMTPIQGGSSLVIHESQSRFWENFIGGSEPFLSHFKNDFEDLIGQPIDIDSLMLYFNKVAPGPTRVDADELTYHFHVMLRFEIEKGMMDGSLKFGDIKEIWNTKMKEYLGIMPKDDSEGVLQDVHWSGGMVGYFPTYSLGTFLSAQWEGELNKQIVHANAITQYANKQIDYDRIKTWLREHIHKYGSTYTLQDLLAKNGMKFDPTVNLKYLEEKYSKIYGF